MGLGDLREPDVAAMERELAKLQVGDSKFDINLGMSFERQCRNKL